MCDVNTYLNKHMLCFFSGAVGVSVCMCVYGGEGSTSALRQISPLRKAPLAVLRVPNLEPINQNSHWDTCTHTHTHTMSE